MNFHDVRDIVSTLDRAGDTVFSWLLPLLLTLSHPNQKSRASQHNKTLTQNIGQHGVPHMARVGNYHNWNCHKTLGKTVCHKCHKRGMCHRWTSHRTLGNTMCQEQLPTSGTLVAKHKTLDAASAHISSAATSASTCDVGADCSAASM